MKKLIGIVMVVLMMVGLMIPAISGAEQVADNLEMWVNCADGKTLNVREAPSTKAKVLYRVDSGKKVEIIEDAGSGWAHVYQNGKAAGYVMTKFLQAKKPGKYEVTERDDNFRTVESYKVTALARGKNTTESVGLRTKPNKTAKAIRRLAAGDALTVVAVGKTWSKVVDQTTGQTGYVANDYITKAA